MIELFRGQRFKIEEVPYEVVNIKVTGIASREQYTVKAFFRSLAEKSANPFFEENIENVIDNPLYQRLIE